MTTARSVLDSPRSSGAARISGRQLAAGLAAAAALIAVFAGVTVPLARLEHVYYPVVIPLVLACGLATGWVRHRTGTTGATNPVHIAVAMIVT